MPCQTCQDYHYLCEGKVPCENEKHQVYGLEWTNYPPKERHDWQPCPDCRGAGTKQDAPYHESRCSKCNKPLKPTWQPHIYEACDCSGNQPLSHESWNLSGIKPPDDSVTEVTIETPDGWKCEREGCTMGYKHSHGTFPATTTPEPWEATFDKNWPPNTLARMTKPDMMKDFIRETRRQAASEAVAKVTAAIEETKKRQAPDEMHCGCFGFFEWVYEGRPDDKTRIKGGNV